MRLCVKRSDAMGTLAVGAVATAVALRLYQREVQRGRRAAGASLLPQPRHQARGGGDGQSLTVVGRDVLMHLCTFLECHDVYSFMQCSSAVHVACEEECLWMSLYSSAFAQHADDVFSPTALLGRTTGQDTGGAPAVPTEGPWKERYYISLYRQRADLIEFTRAETEAQKRPALQCLQSVPWVSPTRGSVVGCLIAMLNLRQYPQSHVNWCMRQNLVQKALLRFRKDLRRQGGDGSGGGSVSFRSDTHRRFFLKACELYNRSKLSVAFGYALLRIAGWALMRGVAAWRGGGNAYAFDAAPAGGSAPFLSREFLSTFITACRQYMRVLLSVTAASMLCRSEMHVLCNTGVDGSVLSYNTMLYLAHTLVAQSVSSIFIRDRDVSVYQQSKMWVRRLLSFSAKFGVVGCAVAAALRKKSLLFLSLYMPLHVGILFLSYKAHWTVSRLVAMSGSLLTVGSDLEALVTRNDKAAATVLLLPMQGGWVYRFFLFVLQALSPTNRVSLGWIAVQAWIHTVISTTSVCASIKYGQRCGHAFHMLAHTLVTVASIAGNRLRDKYEQPQRERRTEGRQG